MVAVPAKRTVRAWPYRLTCPGPAMRMDVLKLPRAKLVVGQSNRRRLSAALMEACAQLREYRDYFEEQANRNAIDQIYGLRFYRPKMIVVIGKRSDYLANELRKAESDVPQLIITTYDDVLDRARPDASSKVQ